jgi:hypothetical protein
MARFKSFVLAALLSLSAGTCASVSSVFAAAIFNTDLQVIVSASGGPRTNTDLGGDNLFAVGVASGNAFVGPLTPAQSTVGAAGVADTLTFTAGPIGGFSDMPEGRAEAISGNRSDSVRITSTSQEAFNLDLAVFFNVNLVTIADTAFDRAEAEFGFRVFNVTANEPFPLSQQGRMIQGTDQFNPPTQRFDIIVPLEPSQSVTIRLENAFVRGLAATVPEPSTSIMVASGLAAVMGGIAWRRLHWRSRSNR